ncbi:hypothetical protein RHGRI_035893 [Rhododendron griersonianum]|uniref:Uncharacterized protein n=1 Tax=Rhododendron griersonianum TaxID=479676 RepID=A0AAV6HNV4_9ERIC|nr:hypothetical protein RHGRI_035893 [Rhododendron griersonianum]
MQYVSLKSSVAFAISPKVNFPSLSQMSDSKLSFILVLSVRSWCCFDDLRRMRHPKMTAIKNKTPTTGTMTPIRTFLSNLFDFPLEEFALQGDNPSAFPHNPEFPR